MPTAESSAVAHVERQRDLARAPVAVADGDRAGAGSGRHDRLDGDRRRTRLGRRGPRRLVGERLGVDDRAGDDEQDPAGLDPVGVVVVGLRIERREGAAVPVGDAPGGRAERPGDGDQRVARDDLVGPEAGDRRRGRRDEGRDGRRAGGRWRGRGRVTAACAGVVSGSPGRVRQARAHEEREAQAQDRERSRAHRASLTADQSQGLRGLRHRSASAPGARTPCARARPSSAVAIRPWPGPLRDEAGPVGREQDLLGREAVARERRQPDRDADRHRRLGPARARAAERRGRPPGPARRRRAPTPRRCRAGSGRTRRRRSGRRGRVSRPAATIARDDLGEQPVAGLVAEARR